MNLVFMTYNNYYNRIIKKEDTIAEYDTVAANSQEFYDIQFNPNDGVMTEQIVNWRNNNWTPDYLVVYDDMEQPDVAIKSRWFVIEWVRTRGGQYKAILHRDVIADNYETVIQSPMFIEKATVPSESDVAIYNTEDMQTNQIKSDEYLMKDETQSAWLVAYFAKNINFGTGQGQLNPHINIPAPGVDAIHTNTLESWDFNQYRTNYYKVIKDFRVEMKCSLFPSLYVNATGTIDTNGNSSIGPGSSVSYAAYCENVPTGAGNRLNWVKRHLSPAIVGLRSTFLNYFITNYNYHIINNIKNLNDKYLFVETGDDAGYYKIKVNKTSNETEEGYFDRNSDPVSTFNAAMNNATNGVWNTNTAGGNSMTNVGRYITYERYTITLTKETPVDTFVDFPTTPKLLTDAPYGMFVIPFNPVTIYKYSSEAGEDVPWVKTPDQPYSTNFMTTIAEHLNGFIYDTQLLPYCPLRSIFRNKPNTVTVSGLTEHLDYEFIKHKLSGGTAIDESIIFFCPQSKFTFNVSKNLTIPRYIFDDTDATYIEDLKIANQCDMYRLNSPNWAASFDFNLVKVGKSINEFNVDCLYKPYSPYIHINPNWKGLYNTDYDDYRGLICQGDFAIPNISDPWKNYMINNKNNLNIFNREIEHIELNNRIAKEKDLINAVTGTVTGSAAGAAAGAKAGGAGAAAGAAVGGMTSAVGGALDVYYNETLRNEALDYTKDQFGYNLQNIQARPDSLAKVSSFDNNNKVWPTLEYYTCTMQEKEALFNKMKYNGMTIGRIGKMLDFININKPQYIKGKLIRNILIADDYHILTAIAEELDKGVFI